MKPFRAPIILALFCITSFSAASATRYVNADNPAPVAPYLTWDDAATDIQAAVDACAAGDTVLVTNGIYTTGGAIISGSLVNRVAINKAITVQSVNGPEATFIIGVQVPGTVVGDGAARCVYLTNNAALIGFTLTNGATRILGGSNERSGGGVYCRSTTAIVSNCIIIGNAAAVSGGGAFQGTLLNCTVTANTATNGGGVASSFAMNSLLSSNQAFAAGGGAYVASLTNCTLARNSAGAGGGAYSGMLTNCLITQNTAGSGGGIYTATAFNCRLRENVAATNGGGAYGGALRSCGLTFNSAAVGAATYVSAATNCTLTANAALAYGGGAVGGTLNNCILFYNTAAVFPNHSGATLNYCCTTPLPFFGTGTLTNEPGLASAVRLASNSPCRAAGNPLYSRGTDLNNEAWLNPPAIGCDEFYSGTAAGPLTVAILTDFTNVSAATSLRFLTDINGAVLSNYWTFGDGTSATNQIETFHSWSAPGDYPVRLSAFNNDNPGGITTTQVIHVVAPPVAYVSQTSVNPLSPYTSWATAATNIQDAINASTIPGGLVLVSNGVYAAGSTPTPGASSANRVKISRSLNVRSVNGPAFTVIQGYFDPSTTNGPKAVRCVLLGDNSSLTGFTITNGATLNVGPAQLDQSGGGIWCGNSASVSNCIIVANSANSGGGIYSGQIANSVLSSNSASTGGAAYSSTLKNCTLTGNSAGQGGGADTSVLNDCIVTNNSASTLGGGTTSSTLGNCFLAQNLAASGGGAWGSTLNFCIISNNTASAPSGYPSGGGTASCILTNCLLIANISAGSAGGADNGILDHCTVVSNSAATFGGGGVNAAVISSTLSANLAGGNGGGTYSCVVNDSSLTANSAANQGGGAYSGSLTNCFLSRNSATNGGGAYGGILFRCTLSGNSATTVGGGGSSVTLNGCVVTNNTATTGGGVDSSTINNSLVAANAALISGGGAHNSTLNNCTLLKNAAAAYGGGAYDSYLNNCIAFYNFAAVGPNYKGGMLAYSCSEPLSAGGGNISADPQLVGNFRLSATSPCRAAGFHDYANGTDLDAEPWFNPPSMGCDEFYSGTSSGSLTVAIEAPETNIVAGFAANFSAVVAGNPSAAVWDVNGTVTSNRLSVASAWNLPGDYPVILRAYNNSNPGGVSATVMVHVVSQQIYYVALNNPTPLPPYSTWSTAATNIQNAIDIASVAGATVLVSNGVYQTGGRTVFGGLTNRVAVSKPLLLKSANGPATTVIQGFQVQGTTNGPGAIRCVYLTNGAGISGFTLKYGATLNSGEVVLEQSGAGLWCASPSVSVSNCVLAVNNATQFGGGAWLGSFNNCSLDGNTAAFGGGVYGAQLAYCSVSRNVAGEGGGADSCSLSNCAVTGNYATYQGYPFSGGNGGGAAYCQIDSSVISGNSADMTAAGIFYGSLNNSSVTSNRLDIYGFLPQAGGTYSVDMTNCLVAWNSVAGQGGGVDRGFIQNCTIINNYAQTGGGGAIVATLVNCVVASNSAPIGGGGWGCNFINCTIAENQASNYWGGFVSGAGIINSRATNSIIYHNILYSTSSTETNYDSLCTLDYSCTTPLPTNGIGNFANDPALMNHLQGDFHLQSASPCINSGNNLFASVGSDREGNPRIAGGTIDMGAYERQSPASVLSYVWAQQYGLPTDGSVDFSDPDHDQANNWEEWIAGTNPTNDLSSLRMLSVSNSLAGVTVAWKSADAKIYFLQRSTNLASVPAFLTIQSNLVGQPGATSFVDVTATNAAPFYYRVGVQR